MSLTTPPRPVDIAAVIPELGEYSTVAIRLHPRPAAPTAHESSIGGPLRWPATEAWPVCTAADHDTQQLVPAEAVRRRRAVYAARDARAAAGQGWGLTDAERAEVRAVEALESAVAPDEPVGPVPLVPVAQLYRSDVPSWPGPDDADLLQVMWCPLDHPDLSYTPRVQLRWRRSTEIAGGPVAAAPDPAALYGDYLVTPCAVQPEPVREYQYGGLLPDELAERVHAWDEEEAPEGVDYDGDLSLAPGWKLGGFASWALTDPGPVDCETCGAPMRLLFTAASFEGAGGSWSPVEEERTPDRPTEVLIGRGYSLYVFVCPESFDHPLSTVME